MKGSSICCIKSNLPWAIKIFILLLVAVIFYQLIYKGASLSNVISYQPSKEHYQESPEARVPHSPDLLVEEIPKSPFGNAFPPDVQKWIYHCNKIIKLIILEPNVLSCLKQLSNESCTKSESLEIYRFAIVSKKTTVELFGKIAQESNRLGWSDGAPESATLFEKGNQKVLISILEPRRRYWYVHGTKGNQEPPRAFLGLNLIDFQFTLEDDQVFIPSPVDFYLWQWPKSTFSECNRTSAEYVRGAYPAIYNATPRINESALDSMAYCRDMMIKHGMTPVLASGTLLGWYRECGVIPYTKDLDIMFPATEWRSDFEKALEKDKRLSLYWVLGKPSDSLEVSVYTLGIKIDIFALYHEENRSWIGGMIVPEKAKVRWSYPRVRRFCTADLKGHLFYVPCDVVSFISSDYGPMWYEPQHNDQYVWYESNPNVRRNGKWTLSEWSSVFRTFNYF